MANILLMTSLLLAAPAEGVYTDGYPKVTREWVDASGQFKITAKLISMTPTEVVLEKDDKDTVTVPLNRLGPDSRTFANEAFPHFLVEKSIHDIIEAVINKAAEEDGARDAMKLQQTLMAQANAQLRKTKITLRYRITEVEKEDNSDSKVKRPEYTLKFEHIHDWQVTPDSFQAIGVPGVGGYLRGWSVYEKDLKTISPTAIVPGKSVFEMTGVPQLFFPVARDFGWRGLGQKIGAGPRSRVSIQIGFAVLEHKIRIVTPE